DPTYSLTFTFDGFPAFGGLATKFIVRPDGSHYLVFRGFATEVNGFHSPHLALINEDGTVNKGFKLNLGGFQTFALNPNAVELLPEGRLITACAADWFTEMISESAALMRLLPNGDADPTLDPFNFVGGFGPPSDNLQMWEVAVQPDGKYLIAGTFTDVAGV